MNALNDELLVAFADGRLDRAQKGSVQDVLDGDSDASARLAAIRAMDPPMADAFDIMLGRAERAGVPQRLIEGTGSGEETPAGTQAPEDRFGRMKSAWSTVSSAATDMGRRLQFRPRMLQGRTMAMAGAAALFLTGVVIGSILSGGSQPSVEGAGAAAGWTGNVATLHALSGRETLEVSLESQGITDLVQFQLSKALGAPVTIPDLTAHDLVFKRGQLLRSGKAPVAQMSYLPATGGPVSLFASRVDDTDSAPKAHNQGEALIVTWTQGGIGWVLAGSGTAAKLLAIAETARKANSGQ